MYHHPNEKLVMSIEHTSVMAMLELSSVHIVCVCI